MLTKTETICYLILLATLCCLGCGDAKLDTRANADVDVNSKIDRLVEARLESLIKTEISPKLENQIESKINAEIKAVGVDMRQKVADELKAEIQSEIQTNTQNIGMFSGGAIYVVIVIVAFFICLFGTLIWLLYSLFKWKHVWHLISSSIEAYAQDPEYKNHINKVKNHFDKSLQTTGLKKTVDKNLKKRGFKKN